MYFACDYPVFGFETVFAGFSSKILKSQLFIKQIVGIYFYFSENAF